MNAKRLFILMAALVTGLAVGVWSASGQQVPTSGDIKGVVKIEPLATIDLGPEIECMKGRQLQLRRVTAEPGVVYGIHSHKDRPAVVHVVQGTITLTGPREGGKEHKKGDSYAEGKETVHGIENRGTEPIVTIVADIVKIKQ